MQKFDLRSELTLEEAERQKMTKIEVPEDWKAPLPNTEKAAKVIGLRNASSEVGVNPKDRIGASKVDLTLIPPQALIACALGLMDGATKYGPYNWRVEPIQTRTYLAAAMRHILSYLDGEQTATDSDIHHLGHVMSCCAIVIDAEVHGKLTDDRPIVPDESASAGEIFAAMNEWIQNTKPKGWGR